MCGATQSSVNAERPGQPGARVTRRAIAAAGLALSLAASSASGLVVTDLDPMPIPDNAWVGNLNGSSAVPVGADWIITARHIGVSPGGWFILRGAAYQVVEVRFHPFMDLALCRVNQPLPGWHTIAERAGLGDPVILGGHGVTGAAALPAGDGYDWNGPKVETWGANTIEQEGYFLGVRFDAPSHPDAVPYEAMFAVNDSGGGMFVVGPDGKLQLAGVAVSVTGYGSARYGNVGYALNLTTVRNWILPIVDPTQPISSGTGAPQAMLMFPGVDPAVAGGVVALSLLRRRRPAVHAA